MEKILRMAIVYLVIGIALAFWLYWDFWQIAFFTCCSVLWYCVIDWIRAWLQNGREEKIRKSIATFQMTPLIDPNSRYSPEDAMRADACVLLAMLVAEWNFKIKPDWIWRKFK